MLSHRRRDLVETMARQIRLTLFEQLVRAWWGTTYSADRNARRLVNDLVSEGWLETHRLLARPLLSLKEPAIIWYPDAPTPDFARCARMLQRRWTAPAQPQVVVSASKFARRVFGGTDRRAVRNPCQTTHDLHVTEVYLHYRTVCRDLAALWRGEDEIAAERKNQVLPDALLVDTAGNPIRAIDFGGSYDARRLKHFHEDCGNRQLPYEVW